MNNTRPFHLVVAVGLALLTGCANLAASRPAMEVPAARLAPISVPGSRVFGASPEDLGAAGYVEQEYSVSGVANRYAFHDPLQNAVVVDGGHPYKTRIIVRRPANPAKFNGTVVVEWFNVTLGQDIDFNWATSRAHFMRNGYAYVAVSAQRVGVDRLKAWSAARYGDLNVEAPDTTPPDPLHTKDVLSWDIYSQT